MSKLQKALGKLRDDEDLSASELAVKERKPLSPRRQPKVRARRYELPESGDVVENLPDFSAEIDLDVIREDGMQPMDEDMEMIAQQFRRIKRPLLNTAFGLGAPDIDLANVIMLASALPRTGKTFCSYNLATSIARERDVGAVLVDADVLKPHISRVFGLGERLGLIDYLLDETVTIDDILVGTDLHGIIAVPAGQQHEEATELLASRRMKQFIDTLAERFPARAIIVDTPPLLLTNEANVLAELMGQIVIVVEAGESSQDSVAQAVEELNKTKPINAIVNKARDKSFGGYGSSGYRYGYGYDSAPHRGARYGKDKE